MDAVPLMDELHHGLQVGFLLETGRCRRRLPTCAPCSQPIASVPARQVAALEALYLLDAYSRRLEEGHPPGERLNQRYAALLSLQTDVRALERIGL